MFHFENLCQSFKLAHKLSTLEVNILIASHVNRTHVHFVMRSRTCFMAEKLNTLLPQYLEM